MQRIFVLMLLVFALAFAASAGTYWVMVEDMPNFGGDGDHNDMMLAMTGPGLTLTGSGIFMPMVVPNQNGIPFWDNQSWDGWALNAGNFVTASGGFTGSTMSPRVPIERLEYFDYTAGGGATFSSTGEVQVSLLGEVAGFSGTNSLWWFLVPPDLGGLTLPVTVPAYQIFAGADVAGATASFNPQGLNFGLLLMAPAISMNFTSVYDGVQFAVFRESGVPEPATFTLIGGGLFVLGLVRRRMTAQRRT